MTKFISCCVFFLLFTSKVIAESQSNDYKGISDPFGDPANYEFAEDEKEDKEFFHLGKFIMLGMDVGTGVFTGGLGTSNDAALNFGGRLLYFFDRTLAMEIAVHTARHTDTIRPRTGGQAIISTSLLPITVAFRYSFDIKESPRAIAVSNPYLVFGPGLYFRGYTLSSSSLTGVTVSEDTTSNFGLLAGAGIEFELYSKRVYAGLDARFHIVFFGDENDTLSGRLAQGDRAGDYVTIHATISYNF